LQPSLKAGKRNAIAQGLPFHPDVVMCGGLSPSVYDIMERVLEQIEAIRIVLGAPTFNSYLAMYHRLQLQHSNH